MNYKMKAMLMLAVFFLASCNNEKKETSVFDEFAVKRGTNIAHWLSQSDRRGEARAAFFTQEDVERIASLGFDHIRLPIDEEQMWDEQMNKHEDAFQLLHNAIGWSGDEGLRVIVDLHILRSHHFNRGEKPLWTERKEQERFFDLWRDLSGELKKYPTGQVAYELMNEAVADDPDQWNSLLNEAVGVIRESEPERTIVIGSNMWQSAGTFDQLEIPEDDRNILLSFHFYSPFALTHHQASWTYIYDYDGPVHYPGQVVREEDIEGLPDELANAMRGAGKYFTKDTILKMFQKPLKVAKKYDLPLYCGEFGVYKPAPREDGLRWYDDMITALEEEGIGWANWCYKGSFGIFDDEGEVDGELMEIFFQNQ
ncbi:MAG: glycoside hydrolase family 5 protein [Bacteroidales bacterium]|nr:glycoside hydrolase family 5 protein [Bacteroidales bacterium]